MRKILFALCSATVALSASMARASLSPVGLTVVSPIGFPQEDVTITGVRLNLLYGGHRRVHGLDLGLIGNRTTIQFKGLLQVAGIFNSNAETLTVVGAQIAGLANLNGARSNIYGLQLSLFNSNPVDARLVGLGVGVIANNSPHTTLVGAQLGLYNSARAVYGFQIGLINVADELHGLQIGLVNIHRQGLFKVCPIINFGI